MVDALCAQTGGDWWFVPNTKDYEADIRQAQQICELCAVRTLCLEYALANDERFGVWGGKTEKARARMRNKRAGQTPDPEALWHGSEAGYKRHQRAGDTPCEPCRKAAYLANRLRWRGRRTHG